MPKPLARRILTEAPIDFGGQPDYIDPEKKRRIESGEHPYGADFPGDVAASEGYPEVIRKIQHYTGVRPRSRADVQQVMSQAMQSVMTAMRLEEEHRDELQQLAVNLVLDLPEFRGARQAIQSGNLRIQAELTENVTLSRAHLEPEPDDPERTDRQIPEIAQQLGDEVHKRRFVNMMIQGNAMNKNYAFHLVADNLNRIDPRLLNLYGTMVSVGEFAYWAIPENHWKAFMSQAPAGGSMHLAKDHDGVPLIRAQAVVFPVLVQEIVKGLMEYLSHEDDVDPETRQYVRGKADTLTDEQWDVMLGPGAWRRFLRAFGDTEEDQAMLPYVYDHLIHLPPREFKRVVTEVVRGTPEGQRYIRDLVQKLRQQQG